MEKGSIEYAQDGHMRVVCPCGWVDYPILHKDGRVSWDFPERVPEHLKLQAVKLLRANLLGES
jgi:hypothetical protein